MGVIPDPADSYDDHCPDCFPVGQTPNALKVFFAEMRTAQVLGGVGASAYNGYYDVYKRDGLPCKFESLPGSDPFCTVSIARVSTLVFLSLAGVGGLFQSWPMPPCTRWLENQRAYLGSAAWKGYCYIITPLALAEMITEVTPMIDPDPRMECFPMVDEHIVVRYAGKRDATNISIKFDIS